MSNQANGQESPQLTREEWYARIKAEGGKTNVIKSEMIRLGFWSEKELTSEEREQLAQDEAELKEVQSQLNKLRSEANKLTDVKELLKLARERRIEESKRKRAERKERQEQERAEAKARWEAHKQTHIVHVGERYSKGLQESKLDVEKLTSLGLPVIQTAQELAEHMGISINRLQWLTYHRDTATLCHYVRFSIPKKSGGTREISAPKKELREAQWWIKEQILERLPIHPSAYGFVKGRNTVDNAREHVKKEVIVKMDLQDFFPSIHFWRVRGLFESFGYSRQISTLLALLTTEPPHQQVEFDGKYYYITVGERQLPQGACTSPAITNLIARRLDEKVSQLAEEYHYTYTRYADDLTFSSREEKSSKSVGVLLRAVRNIITNQGFQVNEEKTRILRSSRRQRVTGVIVNEKPSLDRQALRNFRALLHDVEKNGLQVANRRNHPNLWAYINGYTSYVRMVRPDLGEKFASKVTKIAEKYGLTELVGTK